MQIILACLSYIKRAAQTTIGLVRKLTFFVNKPKCNFYHKIHDLTN